MSQTPPDLGVQPPAEAAGGAPGSPADAREHAARSRVRLLLAAGLLPVVVLALAATVVLVSLRLAHLDTRSAARTDALSEARQAVVNSISFDYRHLDDQFAELRRESTGAFLADFEKKSGDIRKQFTKDKIVSQATIRDAAVVAASLSEATVVVAVDDTITSSAAPKGSTLRYRLQVHMVKAGGRWLIENVSEVP